MAAPTNLETTVNSVGQREDLSDVIHRVAPEKTPFISAIGKGKAKARYHEWQTESLAAADADNAQLEGDDVGSLDAPNRTARIGNYCQIFRKTGGVSRTQENVDMAGRASEMNRQKVLKGIEAKRDQEARFIGNYASQNESGSNPRKSAGMLAFIETNDSLGAGGSSGGFSSGTVSAASNGTQRTFTEALLKNVLASRFDESGESSNLIAFMSSTHKQQASEFTGISDIRSDVKSRDQATIHAAADLYVSDFGSVSFVPHAYALSRDVLIVDPGMAELGVLDGFKTKELAKTGDSDRFLMTYEACLVVKNEKAHAAIRDLS